MAEIEAALHVKGLATLDAKLRALPVEVAGPITLAALRDAGEVIRRAAAANIDSRTGRTAADIRVEIQIDAARRQGVAAVGGTTSKRGRAFVLRFLEFGTKAHREPKLRKRLFRFERSQGKTLKSINAAKRVAFGGKVFSRVQHPGIRPEAPLTRALADNIERVIKALRFTLWSGIIAAATKSTAEGSVAASISREPSDG